MNNNTTILTLNVSDKEHFKSVLNGFGLTDDAYMRLGQLFLEYEDRIKEMKLEFKRNYILVILEDCFAIELDHDGTKYEDHPFNGNLKQKISKMN